MTAILQTSLHSKTPNIVKERIDRGLPIRMKPPSISHLLASYVSTNQIIVKAIIAHIPPLTTG
jgi:hypothetical protein